MRTPTPPKSSQAGFTLIEILIVVLVVGIISSIALTNLAHALDRSRQRATMGDMRTISKAIEVYSIDHGHLPTAGNMNALRTVLMPYQSSVVPITDHWSHSYSYAVDAQQNYTIESFGKDGLDGTDITAGTRFDYNLDLVLANGQFTAAPE